MQRIHNKEKDVIDITPVHDSPVFPFKCPVCNGWGTVSFNKLTCHACKGLGYVVISSKDRKRDENFKK